MFGKKDKSLNISAPAENIVHGIAVKKLPFRRYLELAELQQSTLETIITKLFPGNSPDQIIAELATPHSVGLFIRIATAAPRELINILSGIFGVDSDQLLDLSPKELLEVCLAFKNANDLTDFFVLARKLISLKPGNPNTGSSDGLR